MEEQNLHPKNYNPDLELKSEIIYTSLCENYGKNVIDSVFEFLVIDKIELSDDLITKRILNILNGDV